MPDRHFSEYSGRVRVALVSPYSWTYPGGVTRHIEALADELLAKGHDVRVLAPVDHDSRRTAMLHMGARPAGVALPEYLIPLGGTMGFHMNGAVQDCAPHAQTTHVSDFNADLTALRVQHKSSLPGLRATKGTEE